MANPLGLIGVLLRSKFARLLAQPAVIVDEMQKATLQLAGEVVQKQAIELAPFKTGALEASSILEVTSRKAEISFNTPYAVLVHELPEGSAGPGTRAKPGNELGPAGPKFLERPIVAMQARKFAEIASETLNNKLKEELR